MDSGGNTAVRQLLASLPEDQQTVWLSIVRACYETAGRVEGGAFAKAWVRKLDGLPINPKKLARFGIVSHVKSTRGNHRAYWRMVDREGVGTALREMGHL